MKKVYKYKTNFILIILLLFFSVSYSQERKNEIFELDKRLSKTYPMKSGGSLFIENVVGEITVRTWNKNEIKIDVDLRGRYRDRIEIEIFRRDNEFEVTTNYDRHEKYWDEEYNRHSVEYEVYIPKNTRIDIKGMTSSVEIEEIENDIQVNVLTGDIYVNNINGNADLRTTTGLVRARGIKGDIDCNVVTGDVEIFNSSFKYLDVVDMTGDIEIEAGQVDAGSRINLKTTTGDIVLYLHEDVKADVNASVPGKNFHSDFRLETRYGRYDTKKEEETSRSRSRDRRDRRDKRDRDFDLDLNLDININLDFLPKKFEGQINGGGARIYLSTFNGDIELRKF